MKSNSKSVKSQKSDEPEEVEYNDEPVSTGEYSNSKCSINIVLIVFVSRQEHVGRCSGRVGSRGCIHRASIHGQLTARELSSAHFECDFVVNSLVFIWTCEVYKVIL